MIDYFFRICDIPICLSVDKPIRTGGDMLPFMRERLSADLFITCESFDNVPYLTGQSTYQNSECSIWRMESQISRCHFTGMSKSISSRLDYDLDDSHQIKFLVRLEDWHWATDYMHLWSMLFFPQLLLPFHTLIFHASYIGVGGQGILFTAPSGTGKSTQAELWRVHRGARVLNGDKAGVTLRETPMVHGVPFSGTSGICENVSLPLRAIVTLSQAPENTVRRLGPTEAVAALCPNLFVDSFVPEEWQTALHLLLDLITIVPVYALACTPDERAVQTLEQVLG